MDFSILTEFRAEGMTDYLATPLFFTNGEVHSATWTTRRPGGFTAADIAAIETIAAPLARVAEVRALHRAAINLLDTYVGHHAGERILAGEIQSRRHRDDPGRDLALRHARIHHARRPHVAESLIDLLNAYFDCQVPAIMSQGGEVLKFMGDGLLAIFRIAAERRQAGETCARALTAAREARRQDRGLGADGDPGAEPVRFGLALHLGEVLYGNIGGGQPARLHLHRPGGQHGGAAGKARRPPRPQHRRL